ncbi:MAG: hypothetical protein LBI27_05780 [Clostridiales bacterium]|jgi:hypothetical protein|nr:hypothetical protein [Clostridiales bacterium]
MIIAFNKMNAQLLGNKTVSRQSESRQQRYIRERIAEQEREAKMRETENEQIVKIHEQMEFARSRFFDGDMSEESLRLTLSAKESQIKQIYKNREDREQAASEREMLRQQMEMEEKAREQKERVEERSETDKPKTEEEIEKAIARENMRGAAMMEIRADNMRTSSRTRASLSAEATQLENAHKTSQMRQDIWEDALKGRADLKYVRDLEAAREPGVRLDAPSVAAEITAEANASLRYNLLDGWNGRHLTDLKTKIARINVAINTEIGAMYRDSKALQESHLRAVKEKNAVPSDENEEDGQIGIDLIL